MPELHSMDEIEQPVGPSPDRLEVIRKRADFLAANRGKRFVTPGFILLVCRRPSLPNESEGMMRFGITVTKKIGNAVTRNRMKRRFRALLREMLPKHGIAGTDHIMIGRKQAGEPSYSSLQSDLEKALQHLARKV